MKRHKNVEIIVKIIVAKIFNLNEKKVTFTFLHWVHSSIWIFVVVVDIIVFSQRLLPLENYPKLKDTRTLKLLSKLLSRKFLILY